jgi:hypothetical protein
MMIAALLLTLLQADPMEEKLRQPFLSKAAWGLDFDRARAAARESGRFIFAYFTVTGD